MPVQSGELLGYVLNLQAGTFQVPEKRVDVFHQVLQDVVAQKLVCGVCSQISPVYRTPGISRLGQLSQK